MIHPAFCYLFLTFSFGLSLFLCISGRIRVNEYFYLPLCLMISLYTLYAVLTDKQKYTPRTIRQVLPRALGKYIMWGLILFGIINLYKYHPLYSNYAIHTRKFFEDYFKWYLRLGFVYHFLAEKYRYCTDNLLGDPYVRLLSLFRCLYRGKFSQFKRRIIHHSYRRFYMGALFRVHYIPIMIEQVHLGMFNLTRIGRHPNFSWSLSVVVMVGMALCWLVDSNNGAMGYFWESRFSKTRFRDIDLNPIHWFVVLICYIPFNRYAADFIPFPDPPAGSAQLFSSSTFALGTDVVLLILLTLYMLSGSALAFSTSNLSYKKIQTRGPYAFVRHPATAFKLGFFFVSFFRFQSACHLLGMSMFAFWMIIYISRALVEENFLKRFPEYQAYMKKTRYRFIPGIC